MDKAAWRRYNRATNITIDRPVAVKFLHAHQSQTTTMRFHQEAKAVSALSHPNVVSFYDFGTTPEGDLFLVTDYIAGNTLAQKLTISGALPLKDAVEIFAQVCDGLMHAHDKGIIHRDIKPSNILLLETEEGTKVKLFDLGIAKLLIEDEESSKLTQTGDLFGSPLYMSPEQCRGLPIDTRSDIYSLACVLYEMLCGRPPLKGVNALETLAMHLSENPAPPSEFRPELPERLDSILARGLAKSPNDRYQSVADLKFDVVTLLHAQSAGLPDLPQSTGRHLLKGKKNEIQPRKKRHGLRRSQTIAVCMFTSAVMLITVSIFLGPIKSFASIALTLTILGYLLLLVWWINSFSIGKGTSLIEELWPDPLEPKAFIPDHLLPVNRALAENLENVGSLKNALNLGYSTDVNGTLYLNEIMREHNPHVIYIGENDRDLTRLLQCALLPDLAAESHAKLLIDPFGHLIDAAIWRIEEDEGSNSEEGRTIILDPRRRNNYFNPHEIKGLSPLDVADIVVNGFRSRHGTVDSGDKWSEQTSQIARGAALTLKLLGESLTELLPLLADGSVRDSQIQKALEQAEALSNTEIRQTLENLQRLASMEKFDKLCAPIFEIGLPAFGHHWVVENLKAKDNCIDLLGVLKSRKRLLVKIPDEMSERSADLIGSLLVAAMLKCSLVAYSSQNQVHKQFIYIHHMQRFIDAHLLGQLTSKDNRHLHIGVLSTCPRLSRLTVNLRDLILTRIGLIGAVRLERQDAVILARHMIPAESIYSSSGQDTLINLDAITRALMNQRDLRYVAWLREATAGIFELQIP